MNDFVKTHVDKDYICDEFVEAIRDLLRSISADNDYSGGLYNSIHHMNNVMNFIEKNEDDISWHDLFSAAVTKLRPSVDYQDYNFDMIRAAQSGMSYLAETTCLDNAAKGRMSKKGHAFRTLIERMK